MKDDAISIAPALAGLLRVMEEPGCKLAIHIFKFTTYGG